MMDLHEPLLRWYGPHARDLPWRAPGTTPWGVLLSEVMSQQTPVARVEPAWRAWLTRWPDPAALAAASPADVLRAWDRLGYPRRALRLHECARVLVERHGGQVPADEAALRALPGVGSYTAAAVLAFAFEKRAVVLDTNVRRVLARVLGGAALPPPSQTRAEERRAAEVLPADPATSARWNVAVMELGALVCTARAPRCAECPVRDRCAWLARGRPTDTHADRRRAQPWHGTDRQARGRVLALLRSLPAPATHGQVLAAATLPDASPDQADRVLASLLADGLVARAGVNYALPGAVPAGAAGSPAGDR